MFNLHTVTGKQLNKYGHDTFYEATDLMFFLKTMLRKEKKPQGTILFEEKLKRLRNQVNFVILGRS